MAGTRVLPEHLWKKGQSGNPSGKAKGTLAKRTQELRAKAKELGVDPIDVMILTMLELVTAARDKNIELAERFHFMERACAIAKDAAPYLHPRLQAVELSGNDEQPVRIVTEARERALGAILGLAASIATAANDDMPRRAAS